MIKILLVDDHALMREGIENLLKPIEGLKVIGSVGSGEEAINFCNENAPDLILMDIMLKGMSGLETTKWIKDANEQIKIMLVSSEVTEELIQQAMACKANGYIPKNESKETIIEAIRSVMKGQPYFSSEVTNLVMKTYMQEQSGEKPRKKSSKLTNRESEVLERIALGMSNAELAEDLFISVKTVESHKANIMSKLNCKNVADLTRYAIKNGIISLD